jgi:hypothetical protein
MDEKADLQAKSRVVDGKLKHQIVMLKMIDRERRFRANMKAWKFQCKLSELRAQFFSNIKVEDSAAQPTN